VTRIIHLFHCLWPFLLVGFSAIGQQQKIRIEANFSPSAITLNLQTTYKVTIHGSQQSPSGSLPAVAGLGISGNPRVFRAASFLNGVPSVRLELSFAVKPERHGKFTIPSWNLSVKGTPHRVPAATLRVLPPNQEDVLRAQALQKQESDLRQALFLEVNLPRKYLYEGETTLGSVDLYIWERLPITRLVQLPQKNGDAFSQSEINRPIEKHTSRNGKSYTVYSWPVALTAAMEGMHELFYKMTVRVRVQNNRNSPSGNPFLQDPFFRDPFFGFGREEAMSVTSEKLKLEVRSLPMEGRPQAFRGAIGTVSTNSATDAERVTVGDPVRITFTVTGKGNFGVMPAPEIDSSEKIKVGPPAFSFEGDENLRYEGTQSFDYVVTPLRPGQIEIPAVPFAYFDPTSERYVDASGNSHILRVDAGETWVDPSPPESAFTEKQPNSELARNLFQTESEPSEWRKSLTTEPVFRSSAFWYAQIAPLFCFCGIIGWKIRQRSSSRDSSAKRFAKLRDEMKRATRFNDTMGFFRATRGAIREKVGALAGQEKPETLARDEVLAILLQRKASDELISEINEVFETADAHEFAGDANSDLPLLDWQVRIKRLLKNIRSLA
jgi:hypothetical protein